LNRGLYAAASGMVVQQTALDLIANNLSNVSTTGFKRDSLAISTFEGVLADCQGARVSVVRPDTSAGALQSTGRSLDLAVDGDGYFCVQTPQGVRYTRNGAFEISANRELVTGSGHLVLGRKGPIDLGNAKTIEVTPEGRVLGDGSELDQLKIADLPRDSLRKEGESLFESAAPPTESDAKVASGFLERSNVNVVSEMVAMIQATRHYESCARVVSVEDDMLGKAVSRLGQV
jgi:flagellar basal-body rod protein FlgF